MAREALFSFATGPVPAYPAVLRAMSTPVPFDHDAPFQEFYQATTRQAARALGSAEPPVILQFEAAPGLEACIASLVGPSDVVLALVSGPYGASLAPLAARQGREVLELVVPGGTAIDAGMVAVAFRERADISVVTVVHHETPCGTLNPVAEIAAVVRAAGAVLLVDAVSSFGGMAIDAASSGADLFVTSPGKCLGGTPGLTLVAVSERGWAHIAANPAAPRGSVLSLGDWREAWRPDRAFPFTPSIAELHGLAAALDLYLSEGPEAVRARHAAAARVCRAGARALGLSLFPASEAIASPTCTALRLPDGVSAPAVLNQARALGVIFTSGRGELAARVLRIGHMGPMADPLLSVLAVTVLGRALQLCGFDCDAGRAVAAALDAMGS
jgi:pyridoxamine--pyruvate transaminase